MGSQIGHRWLREQNYVEGNVVNIIATRVLNDSIVDEANQQDYVDDGTVDIVTHLPKNYNAESGDNANLLLHSKTVYE